MAEGGRFQKIFSKNWQISQDSDTESDGEYTKDDLYEDFLVADIFSDEYDRYYEQSRRNVELIFGTQSQHGHHHDDEHGNEGFVAQAEGGALGRRSPRPTTEYAEEEYGLGDGDNVPQLSINWGHRLPSDVVTDHPPQTPPTGGDTTSPLGSGDAASPLPSTNFTVPIDVGMVGRSLRSHGDDLDPNLLSPDDGTHDDDQLRRRVRSLPVQVVQQADSSAERARSQSAQTVHRLGLERGASIERQRGLRAVPQRDNIVYIARRLRDLGDDVNQKYKERIDALAVKELEPSTLSYWQKMTSCMVTVRDAIDATLTWVEHSVKTLKEKVDEKDVQKQEGILRGLVLLTDISKRVSTIAVIQMACEFLDAPEEPFIAQRDAVRRSIAQIEKEIDSVSEKVETASQLLVRIVQTCDSSGDAAGFRQTTREFDNAVREANLAIRACDIRLEAANKNIESLLFKINSIRWAHRGVRLVGFGLTSYFIYRKFSDGTVGGATACVAGAGSLAAWLAAFPIRAYEYYEQLNALQHQHDEMQQQLKFLREKLHSAKEHKAKVAKR